MKNKKNKKLSISSIILLLFFILLFLFSSYKIYNWYINNKKTKEVQESLEKYISVNVDSSSTNSIKLDDSNDFVVDFINLQKINNSCFAWLSIDNTSISYPVVKYSDNDYYLTHSFDNSYNSAGWIFADYRNKLDGSDSNLVIYGHNRKDGSMFNTLNRFLDKNWYKENNISKITLYTPSNTYNYEIFSVYSIKAEDYYTNTFFSSNEIFHSFLGVLTNRSIYKFDIDLSKSNNIMTLSTCSRNNTNRTVVHAKLINVE